MTGVAAASPFLLVSGARSAFRPLSSVSASLLLVLLLDAERFSGGLGLAADAGFSADLVDSALFPARAAGWSGGSRLSLLSSRFGQ
jgi:hypothetical protein